MDLSTLIPHIKAGSGFGPLDYAELMRAQGNDAALNDVATDMLKRDLPTEVRVALEGLTGQASTYTAEDRQRAFIRNRLGTEGMAYPDPDPVAEDDDEEQGIELDFGDEEEETPAEPESPMQPLATAFFEALVRAAQRSGQSSVMPDIMKAATAVNETGTITPLYPIFAKKDRELAMMAPHMAQDDTLEKALTGMTENPFAQTCHRVLLEAREGIANGTKPSAVLASAFFYLLTEKG